MKKEEDNIRKELEDLAPRLADLRGEPEGFRPPPGYFDALPDELMARLAQATGKPPTLKWRRSLFVRFRYVAAAAATILLLLAVWLSHPPDDPAGAVARADLASVSEEELAAYVYHNIDAFDLDLFVESGVVEADHTDDFPSDLDDTILTPYLEYLLDELPTDSLEEMF